MEEIEETLTQLLEEEGNFIIACSDYLNDKREKSSKVMEYIQGLLAVHRVRFDEIDAQLTTLENIV